MQLYFIVYKNLFYNDSGCLHFMGFSPFEGGHSTYSFSLFLLFLFMYNPAAFGLSCVWCDLITRNDFHLIKDYNYLIKTFSFD